MNDLELTDRIAGAAPVADRDVPRVFSEVAVERLLTDIVGSACDPHSSTARVRPIRRRRVRVVMVAVAAALGVAATAAAADLLQAHTGLFGGGPGTEDGSGEFIRLDASDAARVVDRIGSHIALPPGANFDRWKANNLGASFLGRGASMTTSGIRASLEAAAACSWTGYWLDGYRRGDEPQKAMALTVLDEIPTWPATVASDGGGTVASLKIRAEGARTNHPELFMQDYQINCTGELSPTSG